MSYVLIAQWTSLAGCEKRVVEVLTAMAGPSNAEPGCRRWQPHRSTDDPRSFLIYEEYEDEAAFDAHCASDHFSELVLGQAISLLEDRSRAFYEPLAV